MSFNNDLMDDPLAYDGQASFVGGQVSNLRANQLDPTMWASLENVDIGRNGRGTTRRGTARVGTGVAGTGTYVQGLFYYDTPSTSYLVAANNAKLYSWQSPNWVQIAVAWTGTDTVVPYSFAQGVNTLYFSDGIGTLQSFDGTTLTDLGGATNTDPPPAIGSMVWFTSRLIAAKIPTDPDGIYFSNFLDAGAGQWNRTTQQLRVGAGEGDPITGLCPWVDNNLIVFKKRSIWLVDCDPQASGAVSGAVNVLKIKPVHKRIGCLAPRTAAQIGSDVFALTDSGVRSIKRTLATETQSEIGPPLSEPIQDIIDRINLPYISTACATFWNNRYFLALPLDSATSPNYVVVWNALTNSWSGFWTGWTPTAFSLHVDSGITKLAIGHNDGKVSNWLDYVQPLSELDSTFQDCGVDIATTMKSRALMFSDPVSPKTGLNAEFEFNGSMADATIQSIIDDYPTPLAFAGPFATYSGTVTLPQVLPFVLPRAGIVRKAFDAQAMGQFREIQYIVSSTSKKLSLREIKMAAFADTVVLQT